MTKRKCVKNIMGIISCIIFLVSCENPDNVPQNCDPGVRITRLGDLEALKADKIICGHQSGFDFEWKIKPTLSNETVQLRLSDANGYLFNRPIIRDKNIIIYENICGRDAFLWDGLRRNNALRSISTLPGDYYVDIFFESAGKQSGTKKFMILTNSWDQDGDGISDAIEDENGGITGVRNSIQYGENQYDYDRTDKNSPPLLEADLSSSSDWYYNAETHDFTLASDVVRSFECAKTNASLVNGLRVADKSTGYRYWWNIPTEKDVDNWGTFELINLIEKVGREWNKNHPSYPMTTLDMSLKPGGYFDPHNSHQKGTSLDIYYIGTTAYDFTNLLNNKVLIGDDDYDRQSTLELMNLFIQNGSIFVIYTTDPQLYGISSTDQIKYWEGHDHHFHVEINDPDGFNN